MAKRRVVVTGLGILSPVGNNKVDSWNNVVSGNSGIGFITEMDPSDFPTRIAGQVKDFDITKYISKKDARRMDPFVHYGIASAIDAIQDSGLEITEINRHKIGVTMGAGIGGLYSIENNYNRLLEGGSRKISPFFIPGSIINMISGNISIKYGITGPNLSVVSACATSTHSIGIAARTISHGDCDVMLAGGAEYATTPLSLGGFCSARAMTTRNEEPQKASRPFDAGRDGFVLSNGAGCLVLEELNYAKSRGASIYAELVGFGMSSDAYHVTTPPSNGEGAQRCIVAALDDAKLCRSDIDYINAHGTSTPAGDAGETEAIKSVFKSDAKNIAVSSTKSCTGHLLGAAGAVEAIFSILAIRDNILPPTINLENPSPECDLDYVPNEARRAEVSTVLSNSFGFGGTNASLIFRKYE